MTLKNPWECKKCSNNNDPLDKRYSLWKCSLCNAQRWPWLFRAGIGGIIIALILIIILFMGIFGSNPEEHYMKQYTKYLLGGEGKEYEITHKEQLTLERISDRLDLTDAQTGQLRLKVNRDLLNKMTQEYRSTPPGITPEEEKKILLLAGMLGISPGEIVEGQDLVPSDAISRVQELLKRGEYTKAEDILSSQEGTLRSTRYMEGLTTPLEVELGFQYQRPGEDSSAIFPLESEELSGIIISHRDNYHLFFSTTNETHLYIFQSDGDKITRLFPNPLFNEVENPIRTGILYQFPSRTHAWFYLDELPGTKDSTLESFYFMASRWPSDDLDVAYGNLYAATTRDGYEKAFSHLIERINSRKNTNLPGIFFREFTLIHKR